MTSSARRSHSYFEGVMIFQRGGSMLAPGPAPPGPNDGLRRPTTAIGLLGEMQEGIEVLQAEVPVPVHRMPVRRDLPGPVPVAEGVRGDAEVFGGLGDPQVVPQLGHAPASTSSADHCSTLPDFTRIASMME